MPLKLTKTKIEENIVDENDVVIGKISFDPKNPEIYKKFLNLIELISEKQKIDKEIGEIDRIPVQRLTNIEDFEKYRNVFNKIEKRLDNYIEMIEEIKKTTDEIFGNVSSCFEKVSDTITPYTELIEWAIPYFREERENKLNKYLDSAEEVL